MIQHVTKDPHDSDISYIQSRAEMNFSIIDEYATMMEKGTIFDEVSAFIERGKRIYIYDGAHRLEAARKANKPLLIMLRPGTKANAEWLALSANQKHGLRRSTKDKQRIIYNALRHPNSATLSNREIGRHCGVDHKTVGSLRKNLELRGEIPQIAEREVTRNGKTFTQAARAEPEYVSIWQLEQSIRAWLNNEWPDSPADQWAALHNIKKQRTTTNPTLNGPALLEKLLVGSTLPGPRRKGDVRQAANNVLDQMNQATKARPCVRCGTTELGEGWHPYGDTRYCGKCWQERKALIEAETIAQTEPALDFLCTSCEATDPGPDPYWPSAGPALCHSCQRKQQQAAAAKLPPPEELQPPKTLHCSKCGKETWQKNPPDNPEEILCWHCSPKKAKMIAEDETRAAEHDAKQTERTAETITTKTPCTCGPNEYCNHCWQAKRIAEKDQITKARKEEILSCSNCGKPGEVFYKQLWKCKSCYLEIQEAAYKDQVAAQVAAEATPCLACAPTFDPDAWAKDRAQDICPDCLRALGQAMIEAANEIKIQN